MKQLTAIFLLLLMSGFAISAEIEKSLDKKFNVKKGMTLEMSIGDGNLEIETWDKNELQIKAEYKASVRGIGSSKKRNFEYIIETDADKISISGEKIGRSHSGIIYSRVRKHYYHIKLPAYIKLDILSDDGNIRIADLKSEIIIRTDDGNVRLQNCVGELFKIRTEDGRIRIKNSQAALKLDTDDGDITILNSVSPKMDISSNDGDVEIGLTKVDEIDYSIRTDDGDIMLDLPGDASARLTVRRDDGPVHLDFSQLSDRDKSRHRLRCLLNNGDGNINIYTNDGRVNIQEK